MQGGHTAKPWCQATPGPPGWGFTLRPLHARPTWSPPARRLLEPLPMSNGAWLKFGLGSAPSSCFCRPGHIDRCQVSASTCSTLLLHGWVLPLMSALCSECASCPAVQPDPRSLPPPACTVCLCHPMSAGLAHLTGEDDGGCAWAVLPSLTTGRAHNRPLSLVFGEVERLLLQSQTASASLSACVGPVPARHSEQSNCLQQMQAAPSKQAAATAPVQHVACWCAQSGWG